MITPAAAGTNALLPLSMGATQAASSPTSLDLTPAQTEHQGTSVQSHSSAKSLFSPQLLSALFDQIQASGIEASGDDAETGESDDTITLSDEDFEALVSALEASGADDGEPLSVDFEGSTYLISLESETDPEQA